LSKLRAVEGERAALERNTRRVIDLRRRLPGVEAGDAPVLVPQLCPAQDIDYSINKNMAEYLSADIDDAQDVPLRPI